MTRRTSIEVYNAIKDGGLLSHLRWEVYKTLFQHGPLTQMEVCRKINNPFIQDRSIMPRFAELRDLNVISEAGERICTVTQRLVLVWDVTDCLPTETKKRKPLSRRAQIKRMMSVLARAASEVCRCDKNFKCSSCEAKTVLAELQESNDQGAA